ncbi:MAG: C40 family peptidase [Acidimicrobiales bacterium]
MTDSEQSLPAKRGSRRVVCARFRRWARVTWIVVCATGATAVALPPGSAGAGQLASARAEAAAITARIQAANQQLQTLAAQYNAASYHLSLLDSRIAADQSRLAHDQAQVNKGTAQLRVQAVNAYMTQGTTNQITQLFSANANATSERTMYSAIVTGRISTTIDYLHTAQARLQSQQDALKQIQQEATTARRAIATAESRSTRLIAGERATLTSVDATVQTLVKQQEAALAAAQVAAARAAFAARMAAARAASQATHLAAASNSGGPSFGAVTAPLPPLAPAGAGAAQAARSRLGDPYVWGATGPNAFDCSGLVMWAYAQVGISLPHYSGAQYAETTHIPFSAIQPGDLMFWGPGGDTHVAMYVGGGMMIQAADPQQGVIESPASPSSGPGYFAGVGRVG